MDNIEDNIRQELVKLLPAAVIKDISCFMFYDNHPRDTNSLDVVVCTKHFEVIEYYQRQVVNSILVELSAVPKEIKLLRNTKCDLFYLISTGNELLILSRKEQLAVQKLVKNVDSYLIDDPICTGQAKLKVITKDDAVPLYFDDNFKNFLENMESHPIKEESIPIITQLKRKFIEAKYIYKFNENSYHDLLKLRHQAGSSFFYKLHSNCNSPIRTDHSKQPMNTLELKSKQPIIKFCNKQIVIVLHVKNIGDLPLKNVQILLHNSYCISIAYDTNMYAQTNHCPYWTEKQTQNINSQESGYVIAVIQLKELKNVITVKIEFDGVVIYEKQGKPYCVPFEKVEISSNEIMGEKFDVLYALDEKDNYMTLLSILASSTKTDLLLRHIQNEKEHKQLDLIQAFCEYLNMERFLNMKNVVIHRKSTFHILYGVMIVIGEWTEDTAVHISVYSRSQSQVLALIHYMNDAIPFRIAATTPNYRLIAKTENLEKYTEALNEEAVNYNKLAKSLIKQTSMILNHFDECMIQMNQSKNPKVQSKIGKEIDLLALGAEKYSELRSKLIEESDKGIEALFLKGDCTDDKDEMIVDD